MRAAPRGGPLFFTPCSNAINYSSKTAAGSNQPHDQQQQHGADCGIDDLADNAAADGNAEPGKQQTGDQRAADADDDIAENSKPGAAHDLSGQPARDKADEQNNENAFVRNVHGMVPPGG